MHVPFHNDLLTPVTLRAVVVLEVMWDWRNATSSAGYRAKAPRWFNINPNNHSGRRLHKWLEGYPFVVTNACPELVTSAKGKGVPDKEWLTENLIRLRPFDLLVVCGKVAEYTLDVNVIQPNTRTILTPHPAARTWNKQGLDMVRQEVLHGTQRSVAITRPKGSATFEKTGWGRDADSNR